MKLCCRCGVTKGADDFYQNVGRPSGMCKSCASKDRAKYYQANKEKIKADVQAWRKANPEKKRAIARREYYRTKHTGIWSRKAKLYQQRHPEMIAELASKRRRVAKKASAAWGVPFIIREIYALARTRRRLMPAMEWQVDHIVPLRSPLVCGLHVEANLQIVPSSVNKKKNNTTWPDMP